MDAPPNWLIPLCRGLTLGGLIGRLQEALYAKATGTWLSRRRVSQGMCGVTVAALLPSGVGCACVGAAGMHAHPSIHPSIYMHTYTVVYTPPPAAPSCCSASRTYCTDGGGGIRWSQISAHGLVANPPKPILARTSNSAISHMSRRHIGASAAVAQGRMALPTRQPPVQEPSHDENAVPTARHTGRQALGPLSMNAHLPCPCQASLGFSR